MSLGFVNLDQLTKIQKYKLWDNCFIFCDKCKTKFQDTTNWVLKSEVLKSPNQSLISPPDHLSGSDRSSSKCMFVCLFDETLSRAHNHHLLASDSSGWVQDDFRMTSGWLQEEFRMTKMWSICITLMKITKHYTFALIY